MLSWDLETGPLEKDVVLKHVPPFDASKFKHPGIFDPAKVKIGRLKDQEKIALLIKDEERKHERAILDYADKVSAAEDEYYASHLEKAALDPTTGRILASGFSHGPDPIGLIQGHIIEAKYWPLDEIELITWTWERMEAASGRTIFGHNIFDFDLPFIIRRSWILGIHVPGWVLQGRYLNDRFVDASVMWNCGGRGKSWAGLNDLCGFLSLPKKPPTCSGATFHEMIKGTAEERTQAIDYHRHDLIVTYNLGQRLQVR